MWFRTALKAAFADLTTTQRRQGQTLQQRQPELANMKDRLLTAYLAGAVDKATLKQIGLN